MTRAPDPQLDLTISRIIKAPRAAIWRAWTDPRSFEQWWIPEPLQCRVIEMDLRPGPSQKNYNKPKPNSFFSIFGTPILTVLHNN